MISEVPTSDSHPRVELGEWYSPGRLAIPAMMAVALAAGGAATAWVGSHAYQATLQGLGAEALALAQTIDPRQVQELTFSPQDRYNVAFLHMQQQMALFAQRPWADRARGARERFIYSVAPRGDRLVFGPESLPEDSPLASAPGTEYLQPPPVLFDVLTSRKVVASGPYVDEYGRFLSGWAPVIDPRSGEVVLIVGVDEPTDTFERRAARLRLGPAVITLLLLIVGSIAWVLARQRERKGAVAPHWQAHIETAATCAAGLVLSFGSGWVADTVGVRRREVDFRSIAASHASHVLEHLAVSPRRHLAVLSAFIANSEEVTATEFRDFAAPLQSASLRTYLWAPIAEARQWADATTGERPVFSVLHTWPANEEADVVAGHLTADPIALDAISRAVTSGFPIATEPRHLANEPPGAPTMLAVSPVRSFGSHRTQGVVVVTMSLDALLHQALQLASTGAVPPRVALLHLAPGRAPLCVASNPPQSCPSIQAVAAQGRALVHPVFALDQTFAVVVAPAAGPSTSFPGLTVGLSGILLTFAVTGLVGSLAGMRARLEERVLTRTAALRESHGTLQAIVDSAINAIVMIDESGRITLWNPSAERMFGHTPEEAIGADLHALLAPDRLGPEAALGMRRFRSTGDGPAIGTVLELPAIRKGGEEFPIELSLAPVRIGSSWHAVGVISDVSERHRIEAERRLLQQHVIETQKIESLGLLAGGISHDFNNLLMAITARTDAVLLRLAADSPARQSILDIKVQARRAAELVRQLLALSGKGHFFIEPVDLEVVVKDVVPLVRSRLTAGIELRLDIPPGLPRARGDASQIRQLVTNLLLNAAEAVGEADGKIRIAAGSRWCSAEELLDAQRLLSPEAGEFLWLEVADTGHGMEPETLRRAGQPFFSTRALGRGLGLAATLGIVRGNRGSLQIESSPGEGTTCRVFLPVAG